MVCFKIHHSKDHVTGYFDWKKVLQVQVKNYNKKCPRTYILRSLANKIGEKEANLFFKYLSPIESCNTAIAIMTRCNS